MSIHVSKRSLRLYIISHFQHLLRWLAEKHSLSSWVTAEITFGDTDSCLRQIVGEYTRVPCTEKTLVIPVGVFGLIAAIIRDIPQASAKNIYPNELLRGILGLSSLVHVCMFCHVKWILLINLHHFYKTADQYVVLREDFGRRTYYMLQFINWLKCVL